ncbi:MAG: PQQ-binding-like beta-propeller repeat protein [Candidatus Bathyarchaeota archaeon]|nr:PQQ-binding-like beta-propeller repeat protein [Candidatus Bathyarchaeota archaeon]
MIRILHKNQKQVSATILLTLLFVSIGAALSIPVASAIDVTTYAWIAVSPNPAGVGQSVLVSFWVMPLSPTFNDTATGEHFHDYTVKITMPDGKTEIQGPYTPPAVGSTYFMYTPTQLGEYTFTFSYPGQTMGNGNKYLPSNNTATLTVTEQPIAQLENLPLPTEYWSRPISGETRGWASISGPWLMTNYDAFQVPFGSQAGYNPYTEAPKSGHILWTKQIAAGGIAGGQLEDYSFYPGLSYELRLTPPIIMDGKLYYNLFPNAFAGGTARNGFACVDLRTGQELWRVNDNRVTCGQQIFISDANQVGVFQYVWAMTGTTWTAYDPLNGAVMFTIANATSGRVTFDSTGNMLVYVFSGTSGRQWAGMWNLSKAIPQLYSGYSMWQPSGTYNWPNGMQWNMTLPYNGTFMGSGNQNLIYFNGKQGVAAITTFNGGPAVHIGYDFTDNKVRLLWTKERDFNSITCFGAIGQDVYVQLNSADGRIYAYSLATGERVWVTDPPTNAWATQPGNPTIADGRLYVPGYDGYVHVYNVTNGVKLFDFFGAQTAEVPYGQYPLYTGPIIGGDVAFVPTMEHSPTMPLYKGETLYAFDKNTGEFLWNITGYYQTGAIAEGNLILYNAYDGSIYNFGKGPSAMTLTAPNTASTLGTPIVLRGTVIDIATGTKQNEQAARFPNGVPAVSDESQSAWMEYVYMNHPKPTDVTGVPITLSVIDSNGNYRTIGNTKSDANGMFTYTWTPDIEGDFTVIATFAGSNSYYGSSAQSSFTVMAAEPIATPQSVLTLPPTEMYILGATAAIIIAIAIVGAVMLMTIKKRQ